MPWPVQIGAKLVMPFRVMPHAVAVDEVGAGAFRDPEHAAVDVVGHAGQHVPGRLAEALGPVGAHQLVVGADAAGGQHHRLRLEREVAHDLARALDAALDCARLEDVASHAVDGAAAAGELVDAMAEAQGHQAGLRRPPARA